MTETQFLFWMQWNLPWAPLCWPCCCWACGPSAWRWGHSYRGPPGSPHVCGSCGGERLVQGCCRDALIQSIVLVELAPNQSAATLNLDHQVTIMIVMICGAFTFQIPLTGICVLKPKATLVCVQSIPGLWWEQCKATTAGGRAHEDYCYTGRSKGAAAQWGHMLIIQKDNW